MADEVNPEELDITDELIAERRAEDPGQTPDDMTPWMRPITVTIDVINNWVGRVICFLMIPLILSIVFEVFSRIWDPHCCNRGDFCVIFGGQFP